MICNNVIAQILKTMTHLTHFRIIYEFSFLSDESTSSLNKKWRDSKQCCRLLTLHGEWLTSHSASRSSCVCWCSSAGVTRLCTTVSCRAMRSGRRRHGAPQSALRRRAFSYAGPHAWNSLPEHLRQTTSIELFKRSLKTFLFGQISRSAH